MKKPVRKRIFGIMFSILLIIISGCDKNMILSSGYLEGTISIGPICPVETYPPGPGCLPTAETYKAYPVSVWTANGRLKVAQLKPALDGTYSVELLPGNYKVMLDKNQGGPGSSNLPAEISVSTMDITIFNITIDTGIR